MVLDEGGMILTEPIGGAKGTFAMVGLGEKGSADLKFVARSSGGHASTPGKDTPLVRLGKFMAKVENSRIFTRDIPPVICQMFKKLSATMKLPLRFILGHPTLFKPLLLQVIPSVSPTAGAMLQTTLAFTMASGSEGPNVLPQEAWVVGNMRFSHHQGREASIKAIQKLAEQFNIETEVLTPGFVSPISSYESEPFQLIEQAVSHTFPGVITTPYLMTGASDSRFLSRVSDNCIRFAPFQISQAQMDSVHGLDENLDLCALAPAVDFYRYILREA
jgi:carboxypeptidase PM20D1